MNNRHVWIVVVISLVVTIIADYDLGFHWTLVIYNIISWISILTLLYSIKHPAYPMHYCKTFEKHCSHPQARKCETNGVENRKSPLTCGTDLFALDATVKSRRTVTIIRLRRSATIGLESKTAFAQWLTPKRLV